MQFLRFRGAAQAAVKLRAHREQALLYPPTHAYRLRRAAGRCRPDVPAHRHRSRHPARTVRTPALRPADPPPPLRRRRTDVRTAHHIRRRHTMNDATSPNRRHRVRRPLAANEAPRRLGILRAQPSCRRHGGDHRRGHAAGRGAVRRTVPRAARQKHHRNASRLGRRLMQGDGLDDTLEDAARRELVEETGWFPHQVEVMMIGPTSAGMSNERIALVRARELVKVGEGGGVDNENITVHTVPRAQAPAWLMQKQREGYALDLKLWGGLWMMDARLDGSRRIGPSHRIAVAAERRKLALRYSEDIIPQPISDSPSLLRSSGAALRSPCHQRFDFVRRCARSLSVNTLWPSLVTRTSSSIRIPMPRHFAARLVVGVDVEPRFDGEHHPRLEQARLAVDAVVADVMHIQTQPVSGLVQIEPLVVAVGDVLLRACPSTARAIASPRSAFPPLRRVRPRTARQGAPARVRRAAQRRPDRAVRVVPCVNRPLTGNVRVISAA